MPGSSVARGTIVDEVVILCDIVGGSTRVYQRIRGRNNKCMTIIAIQIQDMVIRKLEGN